ncbi:hypothetical protein XU18_3136 [Perkinsela sp. CCAP 1560/4]|nr:hypothetical protein XU18_3136 [Perkinsela sp. CCAP 1560/4]|eukprot:KNH05974.1 hypothetical protein XU18_3136 [Perkinsela sp. CCAP 1560/4]
MTLMKSALDMPPPLSCRETDGVVKTNGSQNMIRSNPTAIHLHLPLLRERTQWKLKLSLLRNINSSRKAKACGHVVLLQVQVFFSTKFPYLQVDAMASTGVASIHTFITKRCVSEFALAVVPLALHFIFSDVKEYMDSFEDDWERIQMLFSLPTITACRRLFMPLPVFGSIPLHMQHVIADSDV